MRLKCLSGAKTGPQETQKSHYIYILTKRASSYSITDLAGTWKGSYLVAGNSSLVINTTLTVGSDGTFTEALTYSDGTSETKSGTFAISSEGVVTKNGSTFSLALDSGKTVMATTLTSDDGLSFIIGVYTKTAHLSL